MKSDDELIDAAELGRRLSVKLPTIRAWCRLTDLPRIQCGRLVRFNYSEVLEWLQTRPKPEPRHGMRRRERPIEPPVMWPCEMIE